jgi:hypothetical protein
LYSLVLFLQEEYEGKRLLIHSTLYTPSDCCDSALIPTSCGRPARRPPAQKARKADARAAAADEERARAEAGHRATAKTQALQQHHQMMGGGGGGALAAAAVGSARAAGPAVRGAAAAAAAAAVKPCATCGCADFVANPFKPGKCNSCFHAH